MEGTRQRRETPAQAATGTLMIAQKRLKSKAAAGKLDEKKMGC